MKELARMTVFGIPYVAASLDEAAAALVAEARSGRAVLVAHSDVHVLTRALHEPDYGQGLRHFDYICPDGMPIVWLMRQKGSPTERMDGATMMERMWDVGREQGLRHFILGGSEKACERLTANLSARYPGVQVVGHYCPPMPPWPVGEDERMTEAVRASGADCVWVGLGCPKQERWLFTHVGRLPSALYFGVGAALDFHAGTVPLAPLWMRRNGLEWLYRLCREPRRLFRRYLVHNTLFLWYCLTRRI